MNEAIERMAAHMYEQYVHPPGAARPDVVVPSWSDLPELARGHMVIFSQRFWRNSARSALEAIRTPTAEMLDAADRQMDAHYLGEGAYDLSPGAAGPDAVWQAMVDFMLAEGA